MIIIFFTKSVIQVDPENSIVFSLILGALAGFREQRLFESGCLYCIENIVNSEVVIQAEEPLLFLHIFTA